MQNPAHCLISADEAYFPLHAPRNIAAHPHHAPMEIAMRPSRFLVTTIVSLCILFPAISSSQSVRTIYTFDGTVGSDPNSTSLTEGRDGQLYGVTVGGGGNNLGIAFKITPSGHITELHSFSGSDGSYPRGGLTLGVDGNFYGTTQQGGTGMGTAGVVFKMTPSGSITVLHNFNNDGKDASFPTSPPILASDGNFYGTTSYGGTGAATVYKLTPSGILTIIFNCVEGWCDEMYFSPTQGSNGNLYIAAVGYFGINCGSLLEVTTTGILVNTYIYDCGASGGNPGGSLTQGSDGNLYGTTIHGGANSGGVLYRLGTTFSYEITHNFGQNTADGNAPEGSVVQATNGKFYGTTDGGGSLNDGTIYGYSGATYGTLFAWNSPVHDGAGLTQHTNGFLYGVTSAGGPESLGTIYSVNLGLHSFITFVKPTGKAGQTAQILGQGLTGTTSVTFDGLPATSFSVLTDTFMTAVVPSGATTGKVLVATPTGPLTSNVKFRIIH
jgi:uncharacterized repeat protein (TIGR03803 family)